MLNSASNIEIAGSHCIKRVGVVRNVGIPGDGAWGIKKGVRNKHGGKNS
jgi:hypothetical protein